MPNITNEVPDAGTGVGRPPMHPYDEWFKLSEQNPGAWIELVKGEDFEGDPNTLKLGMTTYASHPDRHLFVQAKVRRNSVFFRLVTLDGPEADLPEKNAGE